MRLKIPKILIITHNQDTHASAVAECLKRKGAIVVRWHPEEFLLKQRITHKITSSGEHFLTINDRNNANFKEIDVVWYRRPRPVILPEQIEPLDVKFVEAENSLHMKSLFLTLGENAKWVNPFSSFDRSNSKILQLRDAARIGLIIPETIITNDKNEITEFIEKNLKQGTIYKSFSQAFWQENDNNYGCYATVVNSEMLTSEDNMSLTPGIYQKVIKKSFEVRATFFDEQYVAVRIHNCEDVDWRYLKAFSKLELSPMVLPIEIQQKCILLMENLNISFGCFDFIVSPDGEFVFLEINEMGQFLWIEQALPELKLLNMFCEFLLSKSVDTKRGSTLNKSINLKDVFDS